MENTKSGGSPPPFDPESHLSILEEAQKVVADEYALDFGPSWYAPVLATMIGGLTLFNNAQSELTNLLYLGAAGLATVVYVVHGSRRTSIRPRTTGRGFAGIVFVCVVLLAVVIAWGTAISTIGYEDFVPVWATVGWLATTALFLGIRLALKAVRNRRPALG